MKKNPIFRSNEIASCGDLVSEINENANVLDAVNGGGWGTIVCTVLQGTIGCAASWYLGNGGYTCTYSHECMKSKNCQK